jgi:putative transposase
MRSIQKISSSETTIMGWRFWSDGYFTLTVGKHGDKGILAKHVKKQGNDYLRLYRDEQLALSLNSDTPSTCGGVFHLINLS